MLPVKYVGTRLAEEHITSACLAIEYKLCDAKLIVKNVYDIIQSSLDENELPWRFSKNEIVFTRSTNGKVIHQIRVGIGTVGLELVHWVLPDGCNIEFSTIGKFTQIENNVTFIVEGNFAHRQPSQYPFQRFWSVDSLPNSDKSTRRYFKGSIVIGSDVCISAGAIIFSGVTIADGAVVLADSIVKSAVEPYSIVGGNPARIVGYRFDENTIASMMGMRWWDWDFHTLLNAVPLLNGNDVELFLKIYSSTIFISDEHHSCAHISKSRDTTVSRKMVDAFIFFNEIDLLFYRLNLLNDIVDFFVIVEATHTFTGHPKRLLFEEEKVLFSKFLHKIVYIVVDDVPFTFPQINFTKNHQWINEFHQRDCIRRGVENLSLNPEDLLIISDVDEIPHPGVLRALKIMNNTVDVFRSLKMAMYYYNLNTIINIPWTGSKILSYAWYLDLSMNCTKVRNLPSLSIPDAGWHLSFFGDPTSIKLKLNAFSHQEKNTEILTVERINLFIKNSQDLFERREVKSENVPTEENKNLPCCYEQYLSKFIVE